MKKQTEFEFLKNKPTAQEVERYAKSLDFEIDGEYFLAYYDARDWKIKGSKITSWKSCVVTWRKNKDVWDRRDSNGANRTGAAKIQSGKYDGL